MFVFLHNEFDQPVHTGGHPEHHVGMVASPTGFGQGLGVLTDTARQVVIKIFMEELEDTGLADAFVGKDTGDFAPDVVACLEAAFLERFLEFRIRLEVAEGTIDGHREFMPLEHHPPVFVRLAVLGKLRAEESVPVKKDWGKAEDYAFLEPKVGD